jgi:hypothetical protein
MNNYNFDNETDNESYDSMDETDDEDEYDELNQIEYEPEETSTTRFNIVLCEKYNELTHGISNNEMNYHYLTMVRLKKLDTDFINLIMTPNNSNFRLEIAECFYLPSYHCISIIKTYWLKVIQRVWKKIYKERK